jgi:excisionase family DNA binding protein
MTRRLLNIKEVGEYLGIGKDTIYSQVSQRRIPYVKIGRLLKFDLKAIDEWIAQKTIMPMPRKRT